MLCGFQGRGPGKARNYVVWVARSWPGAGWNLWFAGCAGVHGKGSVPVSVSGLGVGREGLVTMLYGLQGCDPGSSRNYVRWVARQISKSLGHHLYPGSGLQYAKKFVTVSDSGLRFCNIIQQIKLK